MKKILAAWKEIAAVLAATVVIAAFCWNYFAVPKIEAMNRPLKEEIAVLRYIVYESIPQDSIDKYIKRYYTLNGGSRRGFKK